MYKHGLLVCLLVMALSATASAQSKRERQDEPAKPQADKQDKPTGEAGMDPEMAAWMEAGTPNEHHEVLRSISGMWNCAVKWWEPGQDQATESKGRSKSEMIMGGRYLSSEYEGDMMGMPFQGMGLMGYDNVKKKYFSGWIDSMSTGVFFEYGDYDKGSKTFTLTGEFDSPTGKKIKQKSEIKMISTDKWTHTMYHSEDGGPMNKAMEITFERAGGSPAGGGGAGR